MRAPRDHRPVDGDQYSPAQEHQGEEFAVALLTGCQHTSLCDEVNFVDRHVAALKIGVLSPPVARE